MKEGDSNVDLLFEQLNKELAARGEKLTKGLKVTFGAMEIWLDAVVVRGEI